MHNPLFLISGFGIEKPFGGIERYVFSLCEHLLALGINPRIFGLWAYGNEFERQWMEHMTAKGIVCTVGPAWDETHPYRGFRNSYRECSLYVRQHPPGLINSHSQFGDMAACLLKIRTGLPVFRTVHTEYEWKKRPLRKFLLTHLLYPLVFNHEIGVSPSIAGKLRNRPLAKLLGKKSLYIPNGIDLGRFSQIHVDVPAGRQNLGVPPRSFVVGSIGRLTEQKGYVNLIRAARIIYDQKENISFVIVGSGELKYSLQDEINKLGLGSCVKLAGPLSGIEHIFPLFDLFVSSSLWEGLPTVVLESMAAGIPVIATDIPGNRDLIHHTQNGWLSPPGDPASLAKAILLAYESQEAYPAFITAGRSTAAGYSMDQLARQYAELFDSLGI